MFLARGDESGLCLFATNFDGDVGDAGNIAVDVAGHLVDHAQGATFIFEDEVVLRDPFELSPGITAIPRDCSRRS